MSLTRKLWRTGTATWRPAALTVRDSRVLSWFFTVLGLIRGTDYLRDDSAGPSLVAVERALPLQVWGLWFLLAACILGSGLITRRHFPVWLGHALLATAYTVLAVGLAQPTIPEGLIGFRTSAQTFVVAYVHWIFTLRTGPRPLPADDTPTVAKIQGEH